MILSMTGHGRAQNVTEKGTLTVELKSVNSRYLDITCKMPKKYLRFEEKIKQVIGTYTLRGKIDFYITCENGSESDGGIVTLDRQYLESYLEALRTLRDEYGLTDDISVMRVAQNHDIFVDSHPAEETDEEIWNTLLPVLTAALEDFAAMKKTEGEKLKDDVLSKLLTLEGIITKIKERLPGIIEDYKARLTAKIKETLEDRTIDEARIITEVALFADHVAVDEEMVRLDSHIAQFRSILQTENAGDKNQVGRKLDFLLQEINREINTTGSKCNDAVSASLVVDAKSEAEKIREQIQNIE